MVEKRPHDKIRKKISLLADLFRKTISLSFSIVRCLSSHRVGVIHAAEGLFTGLACIPAKILFRKPVVLTLYGVITEETPSRLNKAFYKAIESIVYSFADYITVVNDADVNLINKTNVIWIPNGVDKARFNLDIKKGEIKKKYKLTKHTLLFIGSLSRKKRLDFLLESIPLVTKEIPDVKLLIVGGRIGLEPAKKKCEELGIKKNVIFTGWVNYRDIPLFIADSDLCVSLPMEVAENPILYKNVPLKVYEYLACGKPVVSVHMDNILGKEIKERKCGIITNVNKKHFSDAIVHYFKNPKEREEAGLKGHKLIMGEYEWNKLSERYIRLYKKIITR